MFGFFKKSGRENRTIPLKARRLHQRARKYGERGDYSKCIELLKTANAIAPQWAYPVYDLGFCYLWKGEPEIALFYYQITDTLAPEGFFTAKTAVDVLQRELSGEFMRGTYLKYLQIESTDDVGEKLKLARNLLDICPGFAPAWKEIACYAGDDSERMNAVENGLNCRPDPETMGNLLINKALILNNKGKTDEAVRILQDLINNPKSTAGTVGSAQMALFTIA